MKVIFINHVSLFLFLSMLSTSCSKFVDIDAPVTLLTQDGVFADSATASSALNGIYSQMVSSGFASGNTESVSVITGFSSDEFHSWSTATDVNQFSGYNIVPTNSIVGNIWASAFNSIYAANSVIENATKSNSLTKTLKEELTGESLFVRAFCHFYLVNLFGPVPYIETSSFLTNTIVKRLSVDSVYISMERDLLVAISLLKENYGYSNGERVRPNKYAAKALLARVYLYEKKWKNAEEASTDIINNNDLYSLESLNAVFVKSSKEAIWQLMPVGKYSNTTEGQIFILTSEPNLLSVSDNLLQAFTPEDKRLSSWISDITVDSSKYYFPYKYKIKTGGTSTRDIFNEYSMVLRLAEQYLIRSEARLRQNNINGTLEDINVIRQRAGLVDYKDINVDSLFKEIQHQRFLELFSEWGHRWLDLKRTGLASILLPQIKTGWKESSSLYPIPFSQMQNDPNFYQNAGY